MHILIKTRFTSLLTFIFILLLFTHFGEINCFNDEIINIDKISFIEGYVVKCILQDSELTCYDSVDQDFTNSIYWTYNETDDIYYKINNTTIYDNHYEGRTVYSINYFDWIFFKDKIVNEEDFTINCDSKENNNRQVNNHFTICYFNILSTNEISIHFKIDNFLLENRFQKISTSPTTIFNNKIILYNSSKILNKIRQEIIIYNSKITVKIKNKNNDNNEEYNYYNDYLSRKNEIHKSIPINNFDVKNFLDIYFDDLFDSDEYIQIYNSFFQ